MGKLLGALAALMTVAMANVASASQITYSNLGSFLAADPMAQPNGFPDRGAQVNVAPTYSQAGVDFISEGLTLYNDGQYASPYLADDPSQDKSSLDTYTITTSGDALGLYLGSDYMSNTFNYVLNSLPNASGSVDVPVNPSTTFLGFISEGVPISVTFTVPSHTELDVTEFYANRAVSAAPEPSTWALLMLGVGGIGYAARRSRRAHGPRLKSVFAN